LGYDLFHAIMDAREKQAKNLAKRLIIEASKADLPIVILGESYKPDVCYKEGSTTILTGHFCTSFGEKYTPVFDPKEPVKAVYLLGHHGKFHDYDFPTGSVIVDPWRSFHSERDIKIVHYGNTR
jgi:hypothetical protein